MLCRPQQEVFFSFGSLSLRPINREPDLKVDPHISLSDIIINYSMSKNNNNFITQEYDCCFMMLYAKRYPDMPDINVCMRPVFVHLILSADLLGDT